MTNPYLDVLRNEGAKDVVIKPSERKQAMVKQEGRCIKCGKDINKLYAKYQRNPMTQEMEVLCMHCAIDIPKK